MERLTSVTSLYGYEDISLRPGVTVRAAIVKLYDYERIGTASEFRALKDAEQERRETWHNSITCPPDQDGLYWGKKDNTNSMWAVRYSSGVWALSAYPDTQIDIAEWAYWGAFERGESHDDKR